MPDDWAFVPAVAFRGGGGGGGGADASTFAFGGGGGGGRGDLLLVFFGRGGGGGGGGIAGFGFEASFVSPDVDNDGRFIESLIFFFLNPGGGGDCCCDSFASAFIGLTGTDLADFVEDVVVALPDESLTGVVDDFGLDDVGGGGGGGGVLFFSVLILIFGVFAADVFGPVFEVVSAADLLKLFPFTFVALAGTTDDVGVDAREDGTD